MVVMSMKIVLAMEMMSVSFFSLLTLAAVWLARNPSLSSKSLLRRHCSTIIIIIIIFIFVVVVVTMIISRVSEMMQKSTKALEPFTTGSWTWTSSNTKALEVS